MFKTKIIKYVTECDVQRGDGEYVFYTLYLVKKWWFITYYEKINYGLQNEMFTLCKDLNKILETTQ